MQWPALAQPPVAQDTLGRPAAADTITARDTLADTLQSPLARAEAPGVEPMFWWSRDAIFQSGAQTLAELLEVIPGATSFRSGYISSPAVVAYLGDVARVRVFLDGLELAPLDPRTGGILDLRTVPLWPVEEVRVERTAGELRVHLRSWRVLTTTPITRTDVFTGDEDSNLYRGFFGRRFRNGAALQIGAQQYSTASRRASGGGDELSLLARVGWARGPWSVDGFVVRARRARQEQARSNGQPNAIPALEATRTDAYIRAGFGDPGDGPWAQLIAGSMGFKESTPNTGAPPPADPDDPVPSPDTVRSRAQYVATGGLTYRGFRVSAANRLEVFEGNHFNAISARVSLDGFRHGISLFAERSPADSTMRADVVGRIGLTSWMWLGGSASQRRDDEESADAADVRAYRAEAGVRLGRLDISGGLLGRDSTIIAPAVVFDRDDVARADGAIAGPFVALRGAIWKSVNIQAHGVMWDDAGPYRPRYQSRVQLYLATRWLSRFPSGNFSVLASGTHDYKSSACFPSAGGGCEFSSQSRVITTLLEVRILKAVLSWRFENPRLNLYQRVPGFEAPRGISFYGVRWEFAN